MGLWPWYFFAKGVLYFAGYIPLSVGWNLLFAVFVYMVYSNLLSVVQAQVAQGKIGFGLGWWIVHALMFAVFATLIFRRMRLRWFPRWRS